MATLEITTQIGCKNNCNYCPQETLVKAYKARSDVFEMSFDIFKKCLDKIPKTVRIDFSGMAEPWLNADCTKMVLYPLTESDLAHTALHRAEYLSWYRTPSRDHSVPFSIASASTPPSRCYKIGKSRFERLLSSSIPSSESRAAARMIARASSGGAVDNGASVGLLVKQFSR